MFLLLRRFGRCYNNLDADLSMVSTMFSYFPLVECLSTNLEKVQHLSSCGLKRVERANLGLSPDLGKLMPKRGRNEGTCLDG